MQINYKLTGLAIVMIGGLITLPAEAAQFSFTKFDGVSNPLANPTAINNGGQIAGNYFDYNDGYYHGFVYGGGSFSSINPAGGAGYLGITGINANGQALGSYWLGQDENPVDYVPVHAFMSDGKSITNLDAPGVFQTAVTFVGSNGQVGGNYIESRADTVSPGFVNSGGSFTSLTPPGEKPFYYISINDISASGQVAGTFAYENSPSQGFVYSGGAFTTVNVPGASSTEVKGFDANGQVFGSFFDGVSYNRYGFLSSGNQYTLLTPSGSTGSTIEKVNASGQVAGNFFDSNGVQHGYLYSGGTYTILDMVGASFFQVVGMNSLGQVIGNYYTDNYYGFVYSGGLYETVNVPGSDYGTVLSGINDRGQIIGNYYTQNDTWPYSPGFIASPIPELEEWAMFLMGLPLVWWKAGRRQPGNLSVHG